MTGLKNYLSVVTKKHTSQRHPQIKLQRIGIQCDLPKLNQRDIKNLNRSMIIHGVEMERLSTKEDVER